MGNEKVNRPKASKPDQTEKLLEDYNDVFADILNVLVCNDGQHIQEDDLVDSSTSSQYKTADGSYHEKMRDVCKEDIRNGVRFAVWGLENQTDINRVMVARCMGYDYASYDRMIKQTQYENKQNRNEAKFTEVLHKGQKLWPTVTIVLYFGMKKWDAPITLWELLDLPDWLKPFVPDYHINLIQVAFLEEKTINKFKSDFQTIANFFRAKRLGKEKEMMYNEKREWTHVSEMMEFFHTFTGDRRYREYKEYMVEESKKGEAKMCTLLDAFEKEGIEKGIKEGQYMIAERYSKTHNVNIETSMTQLDFSDEEKAGYYEWKAKKEKGEKTA